jgi:hypothetical protein
LLGVKNHCMPWESCDTHKRHYSCWQNAVIEFWSTICLQLRFCWKDGRIVSEPALQNPFRIHVVVSKFEYYSGLFWSRIEFSAGLSWMWYWNCGFHRGRETSLLADRLLVAHPTLQTCHNNFWVVPNSCNSVRITCIRKRIIILNGDPLTTWTQASLRVPTNFNVRTNVGIIKYRTLNFVLFLMLQNDTSLRHAWSKTIFPTSLFSRPFCLTWV